jgi:hypothetical protein
MTSNLVVTALTAAMTIAAPIFASAANYHHYRHLPKIHGYGVPTTYRDLDHLYVPYGYDPDPELEASLRKDRKSGMIDFPGIGR